MLTIVCLGDLWVSKVSVRFFLQQLDRKNKTKTWVKLYRFGINGLIIREAHTRFMHYEYWPLQCATASCILCTYCVTRITCAQCICDTCLCVCLFAVCVCVCTCVTPDHKEVDDPC